jgi:hypothetical protein
MSDAPPLEIGAPLTPAVGDPSRWIAPLRELTRGIVAICLFFLFAEEIIYGFHTIRSVNSGSMPVEQKQIAAKMLMDLMNIVVPATVALFGAATGFYYGTRGGR